MRNTIKSVIALSFFHFALGALEVAGAATAGAAPATSVTASRTVKPVAVDHSKMSKAELLDYVASLEAKQSQTVSNFKIRFNDGTDPAPDTTDRSGNAIAGSKRDGGGISIYGFGRMPITLFSKQVIDLASKMPAILTFIAERVGQINAYVAKKTGSHAQDLDRNALAAALALYQPAPLELTTEAANEFLLANGWLTQAPEGEAPSPEQVGDEPGGEA